MVIIYKFSHCSIVTFLSPPQDSNPLSYIYSRIYTSVLDPRSRDSIQRVTPVATYGCESWTLRKNEEARLDAFEMKGLRKILRVSWTANKQMSEFLTKLE